MKFRIIKGGAPGSWLWTHTIQIRKLRWTPYPRFVWEDYRLGPWFGKFAGGIAYAKDPTCWWRDPSRELGRNYLDKDNRKAWAFIERERARIESNYLFGRIKRKLMS